MTTGSDPAPTTGLTFLSWVRTGLSSGVTASGAGGSPLDTAPPAVVQVGVAVTVSNPDNPGDANPADTANVTMQARLHAPGDVTGLDPLQIIRTYPTANATNVNPDSFPLIEFARPDLPWMLSPTGPQTNTPTDGDKRNGLLPWLCLVVVPEPPATLTPQPGRLATLVVTDRELPDLRQAWLWAHAQVLTTTADSTAQAIQDIIAKTPERALSRVISPRRLRPDTSYVACLVPTFDAGRDTGLGQTPGTAPATLNHAWEHAPTPADVTLPIYYSWRFTTGLEEDFRSLVERLKPYPHGGLGIRPLDIGHAGSGMPTPPTGQTWQINLEGALVSADITPGQWVDTSVASAIQTALAQRLDGDPDAFTPPTYGATHASFRGHLAAGEGAPWLRGLNLDPRYRVAASLGADLIRANQQALMLSAWDQSGQLRSANQVLRQGQLAREANTRVYQRTVASLGDDRLLQLTTGVHDQIAAPNANAPLTGGAPIGAAEQASQGQTVAHVTGPNAALTAALGVAFKRATRPTGPLAKRLPPVATGVPAVAGGDIAARFPLAAATGLTTLSGLLTNIASGGIEAAPPLAAVTGLATLSKLSEGRVTLGGLTSQRVTTPRLSWETGVPARASTLTPAVGAAPRDLLLQLGYLADLWVLSNAGSDRGSTIGSALDWDGHSLFDWRPFPFRGRLESTLSALGPLDHPGTTYHLYLSNSNWPDSAQGGAMTLIHWDVPDNSPAPAVVTVTLTASIEDLGGGSGGMGPHSYQYRIDVDLAERGDLPPGVAAADRPVSWYGVSLLSTSWSLPPYGHPVDYPPLPPLRMRAAVASADLTGTGAPSHVVAWSGFPPLSSSLEVRVLLATTWPKPIAASAEGVGDVQSAAVANGRLFLLADRTLLSLPIDMAWSSDVTKPTPVSCTTMTWWDMVQPKEWTSAAIVAANFTGSDRADLLIFFTVPVTEAEGAPAYRGVYRIAYELDDSGKPAYVGLEIEAHATVDGSSPILLLGPIDSKAAMTRQVTAQRFRAAAGVVQTRLSRVIPLSADVASPAPQPVITKPLADAVRAAIDPRVTVPVSVTKRLSIGPTNAPVPLDASVGDRLQPLNFTPSFPQPFYETVRQSALERLMPGIGAFPDEKLAVLSSDQQTVEAILIGANHELSRVMLWNRVPAVRTGTFFQRFWDTRDAGGAPLADIDPIADWSSASALGAHTPGAHAVTADAVLLIRGEVVRRFPHATIYAAPAKAVASGNGPASRTIDLSQRINPVFSGMLGPDILLVGFPFSADTARGTADGLGRYIVFQEHPMGRRFGLNLPPVEPPDTYGTPLTTRWRDLGWSQVVKNVDEYNALTYLDASAASPLAGLSLADSVVAGPPPLPQPQHLWGFSAAHMAHITLRPPVLIVIHAADLLSPTAAAGGAS